jgi:hypothetical protein
LERITGNEHSSARVTDIHIKTYTILRPQGGWQQHEWASTDFLFSSDTITTYANVREKSKTESPPAIIILQGDIEKQNNTTAAIVYNMSSNQPHNDLLIVHGSVRASAKSTYRRRNQ